MDASVKDLELKYGDLRDSFKLYKTIEKESIRQAQREYIIVKTVTLIIELLFFIVRRQH